MHTLVRPVLLPQPARPRPDNEEVKNAFAEHCEQVDITNEKKDELMLLCARLGMFSRLPAVLQAGEDLNRTDEAGKTSVELAVEQKHEAAVAVLVQAIIAADIDIDERYKQGKTAHASECTRTDKYVAKQPAC
jgi:ankyrin repeat protein